MEDRRLVDGTASVEPADLRRLTMIARQWRGWVATRDTAEYVGYIDRTGMTAYAETPGNLGAYMLTRDLGDGRTEIITLSFWTSIEAVKAFAGPEPDRAVFYPEDDRYLVERETTVTHFDVAAHREGRG